MGKNISMPCDTERTKSKKRIILVLFFCLVLIFVLGYVLKKFNLFEKINSVEKIQALVKKGGIFSCVLFMLLQFLQTTVLQLPAILVTMAGAVMFGKWQAFLLSFVSVMLGSIVMFFVGRKAGRKFLGWMIGKEKTEIWISRLDDGKYLFFLMMVFPLFPDDLLCVVAGLTDMSFSFFFWTNVIARSIGIAGTVFFTTGDIIPFHGWGLIVWGIVIIFVFTLFVLSVKYKDKIDRLMDNFFKKKK